MSSRNEFVTVQLRLPLVSDIVASRALTNVSLSSVFDCSDLIVGAFVLSFFAVYFVVSIWLLLVLRRSCCRAFTFEFLRR